MSEEKKYFKCKAVLNYRLYPSPKKPLVDGDSAIINFRIVEVLEGEHFSNSDKATFKGRVCAIQPKEVYTILAEEVEDEKYGKQYDIKYIGQPASMKTEKEQKIFLSKILTDTQITNLYKTLDNPLETILNNDIESLKQVDGIGESTALRIINKVNSSIDYSKAYVELDNFGLTKNMIDKLVNTYGSPETVIKTLKENPYKLIDNVDGIGFKKADEIALNNGYAEDSPTRLLYLAQHVLEEKANEGYSYLEAEEYINIVSQTTDYLDEDAFCQIIKDNPKTFYVFNNKETGEQCVALYKNYWLEMNIAKEIVRLLKGESNFEYGDWEEKIHRQEEEQGWYYTDEQMDTIRGLINNQVIVITGGAGCVDKETEYFNGYEWRKISEYKEEDLVLQFNKDRTANLVKPLRYIKEPCEDMFHFETKYGLDQTLSEDHIITYLSSKNNICHKPFLEFKKMHENSANGFSGRFMTTFDYINNTKLDLTDEEIRVMVAVIADGSFYSDRTNGCRFHIKKDRKKQRLEKLFSECGLEYRKTISAEEGYHDYYINAPRHEKYYTSDWYKCNKHQREIIADEVLNWDGHIDGKRRNFSTTIKESADFIQFVFSSLGIRSTVKTYDRIGTIKINNKNGKTYVRKSIEYEVILSSKSSEVSIGGFHRGKDKTKIEKVKSLDGYKYCFQVPSEMLVLRRNGKIFISHNCGKTSTVGAVTEILKENYLISQTALSGRAACRMAEITGKEGYTIHRLLGYNPRNGFTHDRFHPLPSDVVIVDEVSMIGGDIFYSLLQAIKNGAKLVLLGDTGQLESIGKMNILNDLIKSGVIPCYQLTKPHRQALKSGIIESSMKFRNKEQIFDKTFDGAFVMGELQDCFFDVTLNKEELVGIISDYFADLIIDNDINDIQVIVPNNERGQLSCDNLNPILQDIYNPNKNKTMKVGSIEFRLGDKVINRYKNHYKTTNELGEPTPIFNGDIGIIKEIDTESMTMKIDFFGKGIVTMTKKNLQYLRLGYCITTHSSQGSQFDHVIYACDYGAYKLLNKEQVYTGVTRAKKTCTICTENKAFRHAIATSEINKKQTFLSMLLRNLLK